MSEVLAWHFVGAALRNGDRIPPDGLTLAYPGELNLCASGLHASVRPLDALRYAPGNTLCRVACGGRVVHDTDKLVCSRRRIIWRRDATSCLRAFARWCALQVADLWDAPPVVLDYLATDQAALRDDARDAAMVAAWYTAMAAARDAAWYAAMAAARDAAWYVAMAAASAAASTAARAAAWDAQNKQLVAMVHAAQQGQTEWKWGIPHRRTA